MGLLELSRPWTPFRSSPPRGSANTSAGNAKAASSPKLTQMMIHMQIAPSHPFFFRQQSEDRMRGCSSKLRGRLANRSNSPLSSSGQIALKLRRIRPADSCMVFRHR